MTGMQAAVQACYLADSHEQVELALEGCAVADIADMDDALAATRILRDWAAVIESGERPGERVNQALEQLADQVEMFLARQPAPVDQGTDRGPSRALPEA